MSNLKKIAEAVGGKVVTAKKESDVTEFTEHDIKTLRSLGFIFVKSKGIALRSVHLKHKRNNVEFKVTEVTLKVHASKHLSELYNYSMYIRVIGTLGEVTILSGVGDVDDLKKITEEFFTKFTSILKHI